MNKKVMVCVTGQKSCERLIKFGATFARQSGLDLLVVHALTRNGSVLGNSQEGQALEWLFEKASEENGELLMIRADDPKAAIEQCAKDNNASAIVLGQSPKSSDNFAEQLKQKMPRVKFIVVESAE